MSLSSVRSLSSLRLYVEYRVDSIIALVLYDWLLTFSDEIHLMWNRKITGARIVFLLNRYVFLLYNLTEVMNDFIYSGGNRVSVNTQIDICNMHANLSMKTCVQRRVRLGQMAD